MIDYAKKYGVGMPKMIGYAEIDKHRSHTTAENNALNISAVSFLLGKAETNLFMVDHM
jgi:hypothetical protein